MDSSRAATARLGGTAALLGAVTMMAGAGVWSATGADLWAALETGDMAGYLADAAASRALVIVNLGLWITGVLLMGVAGESMVRLSRTSRAWAGAARVGFAAAVPMAIVSFLGMMSLVVAVPEGGSSGHVAAAELVGWVSALADDLATALIVGVAPFLVTLAGRGGWVPGWLAGWGALAAVVGVLSVTLRYLDGFSALGTIIIPVGIFWMMAAGVVLLRRSADHVGDTPLA